MTAFVVHSIYILLYFRCCHDAKSMYTYKLLCHNMFTNDCYFRDNYDILKAFFKPFHACLS